VKYCSLTQNHAIFFKRGIYKLIERWKMIVENGGECIID